ncbi:hypothetical protein QBC47DRAFT_391058 [Echria macrotheca]|uniref:PH domain-containing protein n=1 Tax=Echria macrotheca TaxID=438768 RepID=A0AAJ0B501_9PEZI|nr:hypothetical protein QBC47DRAFT_391058 [Echria macrotheca]
MADPGIASAPAAGGSGAPQTQQTKRAGPAIPVALNEAALDSPTFRAMTIHFSDQLDAIERWLHSYTQSTSKVVHDFLALEETINSYLAKMAGPPPPSNQQSSSMTVTPAEAVLSTEYTTPALRRTSNGARDWWASIIGTVRRLEPLSVDPIKAFMAGDLRTFRDTRRALAESQKTFDSTLARYVGQSKTKEPSALREDAFAVYETRKAYLKASLDFCQMAPQIRGTLDKLLVRVCADVYREMGKGGGKMGSSAVAEELERIRGWSREMEASEGVFKRELQIARREVGENALAGFKPSRELEDYSVSTVPFLGSRGPVSVQRKDQSAVISEKQGWLFLRVLSGKPVRTTWVRRWYYCRDGVFGWLVQGPQGVLQGDEIGVLLCSAKPAVQEERRFCFEVKTKTQTMLLQAETQTQLIEWLEAFEVAKKKAFEMSMGRDSALLGGFDPAFSIMPPSIPEFSAKTLENVDEGGGNMERTGTLPIPGQDSNLNLTARPSFDISNNPPRRSITTLGREDGESGREHASRIMQRLDLHRKSAFAPSSEGAGSAGATPEKGGIASLITASSSFIPYATSSSPIGNQQPVLRLPVTTTAGQQTGRLAPTTFARPPVSTPLSKAAIAASAMGDIGRGLSSAVLANCWGSTSWGSMYSPVPPGASHSPKEDTEDPFVSRTPVADQATSPGLGSHRKTVSVDTKPTPAGGQEIPRREIVFPAGYPPELKAQYAQFRLVFPSIGPEEKPVLVFNAAWTSSSPSEGKEGQGMAGNGRVYVTPDNMYFYGHQLGLVVAYSISLDAVAEVTAAPGKDCDFIFLHLNQDMNDSGFSRITIKVFLEDFALLHARLNLLVDDLQAEEPMEIPEIVSALVNLEKEQYEKRSPSVESWEEVSSNTPIDDGTAYGRPVGKRNPSSGRFRHGRGLLKKPMPKFQLPAHAVVYEPEDMGKPVAERHFEISAKACFHVLFGDKSFIFPKLYFERRAKEIAQGPWELQDHGRMKRHFTFKVDYVDMLGRPRPGEVTDTQTIDVFNDHITYVVTHVKTPWHLPHSQAFKLVTKVVITHVAKSKCKLALYTRADWSSSMAPTLAKNMVQRQALDDAANDAEELAEVATDQVRKLGQHSRTKRAIQVYGGVGQQTQVVVFSPDPTEGKKAAQIRPRTLTAMLLETVRSFGESAITSLMMWAFAALKKIFGIVSAHRLILSLLVVSSVYNLVVVTQGGSTWWAERKAARYMNRIGVGPNLVMSKAIYLVDLDEAARGTGLDVHQPVPGQSRCYDTFRALVNATDVDAPYQDAGAGFGSAASKATARRLRRTRQRLGNYRHDLLVAMRVVNGIEREMVQSEWENWLADENGRCEVVGGLLRDQNQNQGDRKQKDRDERQKRLGLKEEERERLRGWYDEYCGSCEADWKALGASGGGRSLAL